MTQEPNSERDLDARLDEALEMTFPASDPIAVHSPDPPGRPCSRSISTDIPTVFSPADVWNGKLNATSS